MIICVDHDAVKGSLTSLNQSNQLASQDFTIVESQRPRRLPLDLQAETHLVNDRYSIADRKWLKQQGITFGTI
ncbi:hypothetical protein [Iningainema tapete]|uniref:hypothetical protein n=1 Tax=Iningainema tapete TaxID=2806730 RepID=UPI001EE32595|nr:hypothetical protein [Iningainema tapete]